MKASWLIRAAGGILVGSVVACSSSYGTFKEFADPGVLERADGGCRMRVGGAFEISAPVAIWTDGGILFESSGSRRDVVFTDRVERDADGTPARGARLDFYVAFTPEELRGGPERAAVDERMDSVDASDLPPFRPIAANHVRVRKDGRGRWLVDVVDTEITGEPRPDTTCTMHFDYDATKG